MLLSYIKATNPVKIDQIINKLYSYLIENREPAILNFYKTKSYQLTRFLAFDHFTKSRYHLSFSSFRGQMRVTLDAIEIKSLASQLLAEHKAIDIVELDVTSLTDVTDWIVICSASSTRHSTTLADKLVQGVKKRGVRPLGEEGQKEGDWILIDLYEVVVHIMLPEARKFYDLEKLWSATENLRKQTR